VGVPPTPYRVRLAHGRSAPASISRKGAKIVPWASRPCRTVCVSHTADQCMAWTKRPCNDAFTPLAGKPLPLPNTVTMFVRVESTAVPGIDASTGERIGKPFKGQFISRRLL